MPTKKKSAHWNRDPIALAVRGTPEWRAWLGRYAAHMGSTLNHMADRAIAATAKRDGFPEPPPPRLSGEPAHPPEKISEKKKKTS